MRATFKWLKRIGYLVLALTLLIISVFVVVHFSTKASNYRNWNDDQAVLPYAEINSNLVTIYNIRNFSYASTLVLTPRLLKKSKVSLALNCENAENKNLSLSLYFFKKVLTSSS